VKKRLLWATAALLVIGLGGFLLVILRGGCGSGRASPEPPAPDAPPAPQWTPQHPAPPENDQPQQQREQPPEKPAEHPLEEPPPGYQWPADFELPLEIVIELPEVPEQIRDPSPPIEEEEH